MISFPMINATKAPLHPSEKIEPLYWVGGEIRSKVKNCVVTHITIKDWEKHSAGRKVKKIRAYLDVRIVPDGMIKYHYLNYSFVYKNFIWVGELNEKSHMIVGSPTPAFLKADFNFRHGSFQMFWSEISELVHFDSYIYFEEE